MSKVLRDAGGVHRGNLQSLSGRSKSDGITCSFVVSVVFILRDTVPL